MISSGGFTMNAREFLETAYDIALELFPEKVSVRPITLNDEDLETITRELEARTGYVLKPEFRPSTL